jgi:eukaryotic-like serine/threonine-protein kinase
MTLAAGTKLGPYEIVGPIGAGGMGEVYRARDTRLNRDVAIKVLPPAFVSDPERLVRFRREAQTLASLNHPSIAAIYGLEEADGTIALALELVEGEDLETRLRRGPIPPAEAVAIAEQIAQALEAAHEKGIVHRDLKPANVKVRPDGTAKVLDFGLAKAQAEEAPAGPLNESPTLPAPVTVVGAVLGTAAYMSPEQARGKPVDKRTDIWAFGVVLFEMLSGRRLFGGEGTAEALASVLTLEIEWGLLPATTPTEVRQLLGRCLQRDEKQRLRDIGEARFTLEQVGRAASQFPPSAGSGPASGLPLYDQPGTRRPYLRWALVLLGVTVALGSVLGLRSAGWPRAFFGRGGGRPIRSIAVLPLANLSGDSGQEYFADGMTDALISSLAKIGALSVISRTTVMQFKGTRLPLPQIARQLNGVDAIVEGSVQRDGGRVRVAVRLVRTDTDTQVWATDYQRDLSDVLALQSEVARAIAEEIRVELTPGERSRLGASGRVDPEAYDLYLRGRAHSRRENREDNDQAIALLEKAVAADPGFAAAHAELARAYGIRLFFFTPEDAELDKKSRLEVESALRLDPESSDAHLARGVLLWTPRSGFPHAEAIREFRRALELNPSSDEAHHQLGLVYLHVGLLDQALREAQEAVKLNPGNTLALYRQGVVRLYMQDYTGAWDVFSKIPLEFNPALVNYQNAWTLFCLGRKAEARERTEAYARAYPQDVGGLNASMQAILAADAGERAVAEERIREALGRGRAYGHHHHTEYNVASAYALLGEVPEALHWLQAAADEGLPCYPLFERDPNLDRIRHDPGFAAFLARQKQQWEAFGRL